MPRSETDLASRIPRPIEPPAFRRILAAVVVKVAALTPALPSVIFPLWACSSIVPVASIDSPPIMVMSVVASNEASPPDVSDALIAISAAASSKMCRPETRLSLIVMLPASATNMIEPEVPAASASSPERLAASLTTATAASPATRFTEIGKTVVISMALVSNRLIPPAPLSTAIWLTSISSRLSLPTLPPRALSRSSFA